MKRHQNHQSAHRTLLKTENSKQKLANSQLKNGLRLHLSKQNFYQNSVRFNTVKSFQKEKTYETIQSNHDTNLTSYNSKKIHSRQKRSHSSNSRLFKNASQVQLTETYLRKVKKDHFQVPAKQRSQSQHKNTNFNMKSKQPFYNSSSKLQLASQNNSYSQKNNIKVKIAQRVKNLLSFLDKKQLKIVDNKQAKGRQNAQRKLKISSLQCNIQVELSRKSDYNKTQPIQKTILNTDQGFYSKHSFENLNNNKNNKFNSDKFDKTQVENRKGHIAKGSLNNLQQLMMEVNETDSPTKKVEHSTVRGSSNPYKKQSLAKSQTINLQQSPALANERKVIQSEAKRQQLLDGKLLKKKQTSDISYNNNMQSKKQFKLTLNLNQRADLQSKQQDTFRTLKNDDSISEQKIISKQGNQKQLRNQVQPKKNYVTKQKKQYNTPTNKIQGNGFSYDNVGQLDQIQEIKLTLQSKVQPQDYNNKQLKSMQAEQYKINVIESKDKKKVSRDQIQENQKNSLNKHQKQSQKLQNTLINSPQSKKGSPDNLKTKIVGLNDKNRSQESDKKDKRQSNNQQKTVIKSGELDGQQKNRLNKGSQDDLKIKIIALNDRITLITPIGQVAGYCSQLMKKSKLNWYLPALLLYKECYRQFTDVQATYKQGFDAGLISREQYQTFVSENQMILSNLQKIKKSAEKKDRLPSTYSQLVDPKNKQQLSRYIYKQTINFTKEFLKSEDAKNQNIIQCTLRMLDAACIMLKLAGSKYKLAKTIETMTPDQMVQLIPLLLQFVQKKSRTNTAE